MEVANAYKSIRSNAVPHANLRADPLKIRTLVNSLRYGNEDGQEGSHIWLSLINISKITKLRLALIRQILAEPISRKTIIIFSKKLLYTLSTEHITFLTSEATRKEW